MPTPPLIWSHTVKRSLPGAAQALRLAHTLQVCFRFCQPRWPNKFHKGFNKIITCRHLRSSRLQRLIIQFARSLRCFAQFLVLCYFHSHECSPVTPHASTAAITPYLLIAGELMAALALAAINSIRCDLSVDTARQSHSGLAFTATPATSHGRRRSHFIVSISPLRRFHQSRHSR